MWLKSAFSKWFSKVGDFLKTVGGGSAIAGTVVTAAGLLLSVFNPAIATVWIPLMTVWGGLWGTGAISNQLAKTLS